MKFKVKHVFQATIIITLVVSGMISCSTTDPAASISCSGTSVTFTQVSGIFQSSCATSVSCHASGSTRGPGSLTTYSQIFNARSDIKSSVASGRMPEGTSLSSDKRNAIVCWVENGALNN
jgi:uncharacterized membrane protein